MKKAEIIQMSLIILGVLIIVRAFETSTFQLGMLLSYQENREDLTYWILIFAGIVLLLGVFGYIIINYSDTISKRIIKEDTEIKSASGLTRNDVLTISILIMSMYFLITSFPSTVSSLFTMVTTFFTDFGFFKEILPGQIWPIIQFIIIAYIFLKARIIADWIERKFFIKNVEDKTALN